ncbi:MAG: ABC transporter permease [Betaproteobacteria bacterium]
MSMQWRKVFGDMRQYRMQICLITLILALGTASVVAALNARAILSREIASSFSAAKVPDLALWFERVTPELLTTVAAMDDVIAVDARRTAYTRVKAKDGSWLPMRLTIVRDFSAQQLGQFHLHSGTWPTRDGGILIEQSGQSLLDAGLGGSLQIRTPSGDIATLPIGAFVHDTAVAPSSQERTIYAFVSPESAALLGQQKSSDQLLVKMAYRASFASAVEFGNDLNAALKRRDQAAIRVEALPITHPHAGLMQAMLNVLGVLSAMALICCSALAGYLVAATMRREVAQVGVMKTLGARSHQIAWQYMALVTPLVIIANAVGFTLGMLLGREIVASYQVNLNIDVALWHVPQTLVIQEFVFALLTPLLAMAIPIVRAARMTPRAAMQNAGISIPSARVSRLASILIKFPGSMVWTLSLRNTWRRPWRTLVMLLALSLGGALLLTTRTIYESKMIVIDNSLQTQGHDIEVLMQRAVPGAQLEAIAASVPEVQIAEAWRRATVSIAKSSTTDSPPVNENSRFALSAYPQSTQLFKLPLVQGRTPQVDSTDEALVTRGLLDAFPTLLVGKVVELQFRDRRSKVTVVGVAEQIGAPVMYTNLATFNTVTALGDLAQALRIKSRSPDIGAVANSLDQALLSARQVPGQLITRAMIRDSLDEHFQVVGDVVRMVALAAAMVGAIILAATTALNILERTRETGIIRTLGATPRRVAAIFLAEATGITVVSTLLAIAIAMPLSRAILDVGERSLLHVSVPMRFSLSGLAQLGCGALIVVMTVWLVTKYSLRKSVRDAISYE